MHNAALAHLGLDYAYLPFAIAPEDLAAAIAGLAAIGVQGFNITIPHKQAILPFLSEVSEVAEAVGAVNTVWRKGNNWYGTNTDVTGFLAPLLSLNQSWQQAEAVVLGNGGAARAVVAGCAQLGCQKIRVVGRDSNKLQAFQQSWTNSPISPPLSVHAWEELSTLLPAATLLINTTPIGMQPQVEQSPLTEQQMAQLPPTAIAYDLIYTPNPTRFLLQAKERGLGAIDGSEMLVHQGAAALEIWIQQPAPIQVMRQALHSHLGW